MKINLCVDCAAAIANGLNSLDTVPADRLEIIRLALDQFGSPIFLHEEYIEFSTSPCDVCRDKAAGSRYVATYYGCSSAPGMVVQ
jgi:hypothetical protein